MADARYVIDLILEGRDQTSAAVNKALANLNLLDAKNKKSAQEAEQFAQRYQRSMDTVDRSSVSLEKTRESLHRVGDEFGVTSRKSLEAIEELDAATRKHARSVIDFGEASTKSKLALFDVLDAQKKLTSAENAALAEKIRLTAATEENADAQVEAANRVAEATEKSYKRQSDAIEEDRALRKRLMEERIADIDEQIAANDKVVEAYMRGEEKKKEAAQKAAEDDRALRKTLMEERMADIDKQIAANDKIAEQFLSDDKKRAEEERKLAEKQAAELAAVKAHIKALDLADEERAYYEGHNALVRDYETRKALADAEENDLQELHRHLGEMDAKQAAEEEARIDELHQVRVDDYVRREAEAKAAAEADEKRSREAKARESEYQGLLRKTLSAQADAEKGRRGGAPVDVQETLDLRATGFETELHAVAAEVEKLNGKNIDVTADLHAAKFLAEAARVKAATKEIDDEGSVLQRGLATLSRSFDTSSQKISGFDNYLRGLLVLGVTIFLQQLVQIGGAAAGMFIALASSAIQAGAAIGGAFVAGVAQALPVLGVFATIGSRIKAVMDAAKQANLLQQQQSYQGAKASNAQANALDSLTTANEGVANAQRGVAKAQETLTRARRDAVRQLQDLILAERAAELAAEGASLSQEDAQRALQAAVASGGDVTRAQLDVKQADLGVDQSNRNVSEARRKLDEGSNPEQTDAVKNAKEGLADAQRSLDQAERGVERAKRASETADANITSAAGKLAFLRKQLSSSERALLDAMLVLQTQFHTFAKNISGPVVREMTKMVEFATKALKDPRIISAAKGISQGIADAMDRVFKSFSGDQTIKQIQILSRRAVENFVPITKIATNLGHAFLNLGTLLSPVLQRLLDWVSDLSGKFRDLTEDSKSRAGIRSYFEQGVDALKQWADLLFQIGKLFLAISGAGGAATGTQAVSDLADAIGRAADTIAEKGSKANKWFHEFFKTSRDIFTELKPIFTSLAEQFRQTFDNHAVGSVRGFATIMADVIIPAIGGFVRAIGSILRLAPYFLNLPWAKTGGSIALGVALTFAAVSKLWAVFKPLTAMAGFFFKEFRRFGSDGAKPVSIIGAMATAAGTLAGALGKVVSHIPGLGKIGALLVGGSGGLAALFNKGREGIDLGPKMRGVQRVFVVNWPPSFGGRPGAGGTTVVDGPGGGGAGVAGKAGKAATKAEQEAAQVAREAERAGKLGRVGLLGRAGAAVAGAGGAATGLLARIPGVAEAGVARAALAARAAPMLARLGRVGAVAGRLGGGVATLGAGLAAGYIGDKIGGKYGGALSGAATGAGIGALAGSFIPVIGTGIGGAVGGAIGGITGFMKGGAAAKAKDAVAEFAKSAEKNLAKFRAAGDSAGIKKLADQAKKLAQEAPDAADALNNFADKATKTREEVEKVLKPLGNMRDEFLKKKISASDVLDPNAVAQLLSNVDRMRRDGVLSIGDLRKNMRFNVDEITKGFKEGTPEWQKAMANNFGDGIKAVKKGMREGTISTSDGTKEIARITKEQMGFARDNMDSLSLDAKKALARNYQAAESAAGYSAGNIEKLTRDALTTIRKLLAKEYALYGLSETEAATLAKNRTTKGRTNLDQNNYPSEGGASQVMKAVGGWVGSPGERGRDGVHTVLGRGEAVLNWGQQKAVNAAMRGQDTLASIFDRTRGFHAGGHGAPGLAEGGGDIFDGHPSNVNANIKKLIELMKSKFPLVVTSTTDHSTLTTSGNRSDHVDGNAVDLSSNSSVLNRAASYVLSSGLARRLKQAIYNGSPQLTWSGGKDVGPGYFGPAVMGQHTNHLHLALVGAVGKLKGAADATATAIKKIKAPTIEGGGLLGVLAQRGVDLVTAAANRKLARDAADQGVSGADADGDTPKISGGAHGREIFSYFRRAGFSDNQAAAWVGNFQQESGLNPGAIQPNGEGHGLGQWGGGRFAALQAFAKDKGTKWQDLQTQLDFVMHELRGSEGAAYSAIRAAKTLEDAVNAVGVRYERYGIRGDRSGPARQALAAYGGAFADGGIVPGGEGRPVNITAHAGEWVLNKLQQSKLAQAVGTGVGNLRSALGFSGGPTSFAGGGSVEFYSGRTAAEDERHDEALAKLKGKHNADERKAENARHKERLHNIKEDEARERKRFKTLDDEKQRIDNIGRGQYDSPTNVPTSVVGTRRELGRFRRAQTALGTPSGTGSRLDQFSSNLDDLTNDTSGVLKQMNDALAAQAARAATRIQLLQNGFKRIVAKGISKLVPIDAIVDGVEIAQRELTALEATGAGLKNERNVTALSLAKANRALSRLKRRNVADDDPAFQKLLGQRNLLQTTLDGQDAALAQNYADRLAKRQERFQAQTDKLLRPTTSAAARTGLASQVAEALGYGRQQVGTETFGATTPADIAKQQEDEARSTQAILKGRLEKMKKAAAKDPTRQKEVDDLQDQYDTATSDLAAKMANSVEVGLNDITKVFDDNQAGRDFSERIAGLLGNSAKIGELTSSAIGDNVSELSKLQAYLATIPASNEVGRKKVQDKINATTSALYDNFFKLAANAEAEFSDTNAKLDLRGRAADFRERIGGAAAKAANYADRNGIETDRLNAIETERVRIRNAIAEANAQGFGDVANRLGDTLAKLDEDYAEQAQTVKDLSYQYRQAALDLITGKTTRATGIVGQSIDLLTKIGVNTGVPYDSTNLLKQQGDELRAAAPKIGEQVTRDADTFAKNGNTGAADALGTLRDAFAKGPTAFAETYAKMAPQIAELESHMSPDELKLFQSLLDAMFANTASLVDNTKAVDDASGASQGPQSFASSSWTWFRNAMFSGMGDVLPQYDVPHMATGGSIRKGGIFELHPGEFVVNPEGSNVPDSGDINITMNSVDGNVDLTALAARIAFAKKNRG